MQRYGPEVAKRGQRDARPVRRSWRSDETYSKRRGTWAHLYRGGDTDGQTLALFLSPRREIAAAQRCLRRALEKCGVPQESTLAGYAASPIAVSELQAEGTLPSARRVRTNRSLNNVIGQDHRRVKQRVRPMLGFKRFAHAAVTISGIELVRQMKKGRCDIAAGCPPQTRPPQIRESVRAA